MRLAGKTYREIADEVGVSLGTVCSVLSSNFDWEEYSAPYIPKAKIKKPQIKKKHTPTIKSNNQCLICNAWVLKIMKYCDTCRPQFIKLQGRDRTREMVRIRDNYTCQMCGRKKGPREKNLDVHHLGGDCGKNRTYSYDKVCDMPKLITLCHKCHFNHPEHSIHLTSKK